MAGDQQHWWERPAFLWLVIVLAGVPLWFPAVPPLTDFPGHMGRYFIQLEGARSADLAHWYTVDWSWIGNLGVDLLVQLIGPILGVEAASKIIVVTIPMITAAGFLMAAREVHGRVPPTAFFALPLAYSYPFLWGFVNFALSMALAFLAFALWLRLGRAGRAMLRFCLFLPLSLALWTAHIFGWAALIVLVGSAEFVASRPFRRGWFLRIGHAVLALLCLLPPLALMLLRFRAGGAGGQPWARVWFHEDLKQRWVESIFRDRWEMFDTASLWLLAAVLFMALGRWLWVRRAPSGGPLILAALIFAGLFALLPHALLGSAYADMRLAPYALATALLAIGPLGSAGRWVALASLGFFLVRLGGTGLSMAAYDQSYRAELAALDHLPKGARLLTLVGKPCAPGWAVHRLDHLASLALIRKGAFANDQWDAAGAQVIRVRYAAAGAFASDPSQFVVEPRCARWERTAFDRALADFPRTAFDYVWIIRQPAGRYDLSGLQPVWWNGSSALFRVVTTK